MKRTIYNRNTPNLVTEPSIPSNINSDTSAKGPLTVLRVNTEYLNVSSLNRDLINYPLHYNYKLNLPTEFKNVIRVSLVHLMIPNTGSILDEPVISLSISELNDTTRSLISGSEIKTFAILPVTSPNKTTGGFINTDINTVVCKEFTVPIRLTSLTVKILDYNGELYDFGAPAGSSSKALQHNFMLKIESSAFV